jgi:hypothetical protein
MSSRIQDRYATAVHSSDLGVDGKTTMSDSDTLGAYGIAGRVLEEGMTRDGTPITPSPLAVPLERLFAGDNNSVYDIVRQLAEMAHGHSFRLKVKISRTQARDIAEACLAWHRNGTCRTCEGRGYALITGTKSLSERECQDCCAGHIPARWRTPGKLPFERQFRPEWRDLARWLVSQMEAAAGRAGPEAMKALAPRLDL